VLFTFQSPPKDIFVVPVKLDLVEFTPGEPEEELVFSNWGNVEDYSFFVSMFCGHLGVYLLSDFVEGFSGDHLEKEGVGAVEGGDLMGGDKPGVDKVSHGARVYEG